MCAKLVTTEPFTPKCQMYCISCRYDLRGSIDSGRCPECGRVFDPNDKRTYRTHPGLTPNTRQRITLCIQSIAFGWIAMLALFIIWVVYDQLHGGGNWLLAWGTVLLSLILATVTGIILIPLWWHFRQQFRERWHRNRLDGAMFISTYALMKCLLVWMIVFLLYYSIINVFW